MQTKQKHNCTHLGSKRDNNTHKTGNIAINDPLTDPDATKRQHLIKGKILTKHPGMEKP